jgi:hypothetical protein
MILKIDVLVLVTIFRNAIPFDRYEIAGVADRVTENGSALPDRL